MPRNTNGNGGPEDPTKITSAADEEHSPYEVDEVRSCTDFGSIFRMLSTPLVAAPPACSKM